MIDEILGMTKRKENQCGFATEYRTRHKEIKKKCKHSKGEY